MFFAAMSAILGDNHSLAKGYVSTPLAIGYIFQTFENGIGNINAPTINFVNDKKRDSALDYTIIGAIYTFWMTA